MKMKVQKIGANLPLADSYKKRMDDSLTSKESISNFEFDSQLKTEELKIDAREWMKTICCYLQLLSKNNDFNESISIIGIRHDIPTQRYEIHVDGLIKLAELLGEKTLVTEYYDEDYGAMKSFLYNGVKIKGFVDERIN